MRDFLVIFFTSQYPLRSLIVSGSRTIESQEPLAKSVFDIGREMQPPINSTFVSSVPCPRAWSHLARYVFFFFAMYTFFCNCHFISCFMKHTFFSFLDIKRGKGLFKSRVASNQHRPSGCRRNELPHDRKDYEKDGRQHCQLYRRRSCRLWLEAYCVICTLPQAHFNSRAG